MNALYRRSFTSINSLYKKARFDGLDVSRKTVAEFLRGEKCYSLHRQTRKNFKGNKIKVIAINQMWSIDLAAMKNPVVNQGTKWLLVILDAMSRKLRVTAMKNKSGPTTAKALAEIFENDAVPYLIRTDLSTEFFNSHVKALLTKNGVKHYKALNRTKAAFSERAMRTLKSRLYRYLTEHNTKRYITALEDLVEDINNTPNRSIKMAPNEVTEENQVDLAPDSVLTPTSWPELSVGDVVRISLKVDPKTFTKGYKTQWSEYSGYSGCLG